MRIVLISIVFMSLIGCSSDQTHKITDTSVSGNDTLVFYNESVEEANAYQQLLKVVNTSDSTIWYALEFVNQSGNKTITGEGIDIYYNLDPEIDEINGEAQPVLEFESTTENKGLVIRIDMMEQKFAKVLTSPDYTSKEIPLDVVLIKR
jgi:hypothetical protein